MEKWGVQDRSPFEWLCFLSEEHGELAEAIAENYYRRSSLEDVVQEAVQITTLALKIAEMYQPRRTPSIEDPPIGDGWSNPY